MLIGTLLDAIGSGIYLVFFFQCISVLWTKHCEGRPSALYFLGIALTIFALVTMNLTSNILRALQAFTEHTQSSDWANSFYADLDTNLVLIKDGAYVAVTLVSDLLFVYRVFVVWGCKYSVAVLPFLLFLADLGLSVLSNWSITQTNDGGSALEALLEAVTKRTQYFYTVTLVLNILCTFLVSYKIWATTRRVSGSATDSVRLKRLISILVESAALYSAFSIMLLVTAVIGSPLMFTFLDCMSPLIGVVFSVVIIRSSTEFKTKEVRSITGIGFATGPSTGAMTQEEPSHPEAVHIQLEQITHLDELDGETSGKVNPSGASFA